MDIIVRWQNIFGLNLKSYEGMIDKGMRQIKEEIEEQELEFEWYRYEITQLTNGAMAILLYGDEKDGSTI